jgi:hypothetical protein
VGGVFQRNLPDGAMHLVPFFEQKLG